MANANQTEQTEAEKAEADAKAQAELDAEAKEKEEADAKKIASGKTTSKKASTQVTSVMESTLNQAEKLVALLEENKTNVGSDIAQREIAVAVEKANEIVSAMHRAILADR